MAAQGIIGGYTDNEVEEIFDRFVASLDRGIYIDGNFVPIEIEGADWVDKDDSLLKAQVAVQVMITFNGGVYRDTGFAPLTDVRVTSVEFLSTPSARRATAKTETKSLFSNKLYNILHEFRRALIYNGSKNYPNHAK